MRHSETGSRDSAGLPRLSVLYYGSYAGADEAFLRLGREVKERGLTPAGDRVCWVLLRPTPGAKSKPNGIAPAWCCRWRAKPNRLSRVIKSEPPEGRLYAL